MGIIGTIRLGHQLLLDLTLIYSTVRTTLIQVMSITTMFSPRRAVNDPWLTNTTRKLSKVFLIAALYQANILECLTKQHLVEQILVCYH
jgi:hypothetical protein